MNLIPRKLLFGTLGMVVAIAIAAATAEAALVYRAIGPFIAAALGVAVLPVLLRGASSGVMGVRTAWGTALVGCLICCTATIGLDPSRLDSLSIGWYTCGVLAGSVMVSMAGHRWPPRIAVSCLVLQVMLWAGPVGVIRLGLAAEIVFVITGLVMHRAMLRLAEATRLAVAQERETSIWQAEQEAFRLERTSRLRLASRNTAPMLRRIVARSGRLDEAARAECLLLEQTLRDEIRGRRLLNDAVRRVVLAQRHRGAHVHLLDDGGLNDLAPSTLGPMLNDLARRIEPIRSSRIVIRTGQPDSTTAITVVASTPDETSVALGLDDEQIDLWTTIPRPAVALTP